MWHPGFRPVLLRMRSRRQAEGRRAPESSGAKADSIALRLLRLRHRAWSHVRQMRNVARHALLTRPSSPDVGTRPA